MHIIEKNFLVSRSAAHHRHRHLFHRRTHKSNFIPFMCLLDLTTKNTQRRNCHPQEKKKWIFLLFFVLLSSCFSNHSISIFSFSILCLVFLYVFFFVFNTFPFFFVFALNNIWSTNEFNFLSEEKLNQLRAYFQLGN